ncbi:MAG: RDD family protein [Paludibacteraceae bacterium]|nr:RDD family protein [Paludibacteraceae bacterium]
MNDRLEIVNGQYVKMNYTLAQPETRLLAVVLDRTIQYIVGIALALIIVNNFGSDDTIMYLLIFLEVAIYLMNLILEYCWHGKTLGKKILKIKVITENCQPPSFQQCFMRWVIYPIDFWIIGFVMISKHGQRFGDMASGCYVVNEWKKKIVRASIAEEYRYVEPDYRPHYTNLEQMGEREVQFALRALYEPNFISQQDEIAKMLCKKLQINQDGMNSETFLKQLYNDYQYALIRQESERE